MATYAPYSTGTVTATNGSPTVTGSGTSWSDTNASAGSKITISGVEYVIQSRDSSTQLTLASNYAESTGSGKPYIIKWLKNPTNLTANEAVTINTGVTVEITSSAYSTNGCGNLAINDGRLLLKNESTSTGLKFTFNSTSTTQVIGGRGIFETQGDRIQIGTGNGNSGQTATAWDSDYVPYVLVETGSGTGIYEKYLNLSGGQSSTNHPTLAQAAGAGEYGLFFTQSGATLTFGDGTNGKCPPNGAKILMDNIIVTTNGAYTTSITNFPTNQSSGALVTDKSIFSRQRLALTGTNGNVLKNSGFVGISTTTYTPYFEVTDCAVVPSADPTSTTGRTIDIAGGNIKFIRCSAWGNNTNGTVGASGGSLPLTVEMEDCTILHLNTTISNTGIAVGPGGSQLGSVKIDGGLYSGKIVVIVNNVLKNFTWVDNMQLAANSNSAKYMVELFSASASSTRIENVYVPDGGGSTAPAIYLHSSNEVYIKGLNIQSTQFSALMAANTNATINKLSVMDCFIKGATGSGYFWPLSAVWIRDVLVQNVTSEKYNWSVSMIYKNAVLKGFPLGAITVNGQEDTFFGERYTSSTQGSLELYCNHKINSNQLSIAGNPVSDKAGKYYLYTAGDRLTYEWPHKILGITSFQNVSPSVTGTLTNLDIEYAIDTGSGYSSWKTLSAANLSGETVSATDGFRFKIRITCNADNTTNYITSVLIQTNIDQSIKYPVNLVSLKLENVVAGSRYLIIKSSDNSTIASGEATGTGNVDVEIQNIPYSSDTDVTVRVRKPGYVPFETGGTITSSGLNTYVSQVTDQIYQ